MIYNELAERGTEDFPVAFYHLDAQHPRYVMQPHWHRELEIIFVRCGSLRLVLNSAETYAKAGDVVFVNSEIIHGAQPFDCVYDCLVFDPEKVLLHAAEGRRLASGLVDHTLFLRQTPEQGQEALREAVRGLFDSFFEFSDESRELAVIGRIYELFSVICREHFFTDRAAQGDPLRSEQIIKLKRALGFIRENYKSSFSLGELSQAAGISPKSFCALFKSMTGMTAFDYLNAYRIEKAARALLSTDAAVTEISYACGFNDLSYFIKTFKKYKGTTPKRFRDAHG